MISILRLKLLLMSFKINFLILLPRYKLFLSQPQSKIIGIGNIDPTGTLNETSYFTPFYYKMLS